MYSTGSATGVTDLVDKIAAFIEANGWTRDSLAADGTGKRYHAHRGTTYVNMRSLVAEAPASAIAGSPSAMTGLAYNVGTGYSAGSSWYNQAGVPLDTLSEPIVCGMSNIPGSLPSYHFFAHNSGDNILIVVEWTAGFFQFIGFGTLSKIGTYTGGEYFFGSTSGISDIANGRWNASLGVHVTSAASLIGGHSSNQYPSFGFVKVNVDSETGWHFGDGVMQLNLPTARKVRSNLVGFTTLLAGQPNTLNGLAVLSPVIVSVFRDTSNVSGTSPISVIGEVPKIFYIDITNLTPKDQLAVGAVNYRVFPFVSKGLRSSGLPTVTGTSGVNTNTFDSGCWGFAVAE
jgi:hypothetical protein